MKIPFDVDAYFAFHPGKDPNNIPVSWYVLNLFRNKDNYLESQKITLKTHADIATAIKNKYKLPVSPPQSSISKALKMYSIDLLIKGKIYCIAKYDGIYALYPKDIKLKELYESKNLFAKDEVHTISNNTLAFLLQPETAKNTYNMFKNSFPESTFFNILLYENTLILMLNKNTPGFKSTYSLLVNFFIDRAIYLKKIQKRKMTDTAIKKKSSKFGNIPQYTGKI